MGARAATLGEGGGGKFNNVDGVIKDYEFTTTHPFAKEGGKRKGGSDFNPLYGVITAQMDGATDPDVDVMLVGSADDFDISDEGKTITPSNEGDKIWGKSQWGKLIASMEKLSIATENDEYDEGVYNYEPIINRRVRFSQEQQVDKNGKVKVRMGKGRDGKPREYNDTTTVVVADYGYVEVAAAGKKGAKKGTAAPSTTTKAAGGKPNGAAKDVDITDDFDSALTGLLTKFGGSCPKDKLVGAPAQLYLKKNHADLESELRALLHDDAALNDAVERGIISEYKQASKDKTVSA